MTTDLLAMAAALSNTDLLARLGHLAAEERDATVELVAHLIELERRKIYLAEGYGSLFNYCRGALRLSEHVAYNCLEATRTARSYPAVLDLLRSGDLNLTTLRILGPYLTAPNHEAVLAEAAGRSKRDVEMIVARLAPLPDVPSFLRKLPVRAMWAHTITGSAATVAGSAAAVSVRAPEVSGTAPDVTGSAAGVTDRGPAITAASGLTDCTPADREPIPFGGGRVSGPDSSSRSSWAGALPPTARPIIAALAPERFRVQFTVGKETHEKLRFAQDMLRREIPDGDPGTIFDRALTLLLDEVARKKMAATAAPGPDRITAPGSRHIPAAVKRAVWFRDRGQCAFVSAQGRRCKERSFLELHHIQPFALGGEGTTANISLRCHQHNAHEAEIVFGPWVTPSVHEAKAPYTGVESLNHGSHHPAPGRA